MRKGLNKAAWRIKLPGSRPAHQAETCTLHRLYYCTTNHQKAIHYGCFSELPKGAVTLDLKVSILFKYVETGLISWALTYSILERALHPLAISWLVISEIPRLYLLEARSSESCTESLADFRILWWILSWFTWSMIFWILYWILSWFQNPLVNP